MKLTETDIEDVLLIKPKVHGDQRGFFCETYRESVFREHGVDTHFVQDNLSSSRKNAIRGLHYQIKNPQAKLLMVPRGKILDVAVDLRKGSPTFGKHTSAVLSEENRHLLYIPAGFAHGFSVLSEETLVFYKCSDYYNPDGERGLSWDDPALDIDWRVHNPILSEKDRSHPVLKDIPDQDLFTT